MSKAAVFAVSLAITGDGQSLTWAPATAVGNAASPAVTLQVTLSSGTTTIAVPTGSVGFCYVPPVNSVVTKQLKGNSGDTGLPMSTSYPSPYDWEGSATPPANIYITANAIEAGLIYFF